MDSNSRPYLLDTHVHTVGGTTIVSVRGEVDMASAPELQTVLEVLYTTLEDTRREGTALIVDMSDIGFFGSAGLSVLLGIAETRAPTKLRVVASTAVRRSVELTGLDNLVALYNSVDAALIAKSGTPAA